jgi:hypothetical protein
VALHFVAQLLGDSPAVVETFYSHVIRVHSEAVITIDRLFT